MGELSNPLHLATLGSALLWPLAAGVAVVAWSRSRAAARAKKAAAVEGQLKELYRQVEARPVPPRLRLVVDALEEGEELAAAGAKAGARKGTPAGS
jgi:hypothetical protein